MNEFVEECRREWSRLGVPDPVAAEMAADLAADLEEAESEGASPQDVLGTGAFDPRSFATAWAVERGVIGPPPRNGHRPPRGTRLPAAIGVLALVAIVGAVLVILDSPSATGPQAIVALDPPPAVERLVVSPDGTTLVAPTHFVRLDRSGDDTRTAGSVLLIVGLAGIALVSSSWLWLASRRSRRPRDAGWV